MATLEDIELTTLGIAKALSAAADIRAEAGAISAPTTLAEALADAINLGAGILGRDRRSPFVGQPASFLPGATHELARYNAAVLVAADFLCRKPQPISSASIAFGVRGKAVDVFENFVGMERSMMLLAGTIPLAAAIDSDVATDDELAGARATVMSALEWAIAESAALDQMPAITAAAA